MRILEILEKERGELFVHTLCYTGINAAGKASFNGTEKELFLLPPGGFSSLPDNAAGSYSRPENSPRTFSFPPEKLFFGLFCRPSLSETQRREGDSSLYPQKRIFYVLSMQGYSLSATREAGEKEKTLQAPPWPNG
jgi:hypothetical protein